MDQSKSEKSHVEKTKKQPADKRASIALPKPECGGSRYRDDGDLYAVPGDRDPRPVRCLTFTEDLLAAPDCLKSCHIERVAIESTGVKLWCGSPRDVADGSTKLGNIHAELLQARDTNCCRLLHR
jgi:hypothetical protein